MRKSFFNPDFALASLLRGQAKAAQRAASLDFVETCGVNPCGKPQPKANFAFTFLCATIRRVMSCNAKFGFNSPNVLISILSLSFCLFCGFTPQSDIEMAIMNKDFKAAKILSEIFIKENPSSPQIPQVYYYLGISELGLSHYKEARSEFERVLHFSAKDNLYDKAWIGIIDSLGMERSFEEALSQAQEFLAQRPNSEFLSVIYLKLARANFKLSNWEKAERYLNKIIHDFPKSFEAHTAGQLLHEKRFFSIQVGSFLEQARAMTLAEELKNKGEYAYLVETQDKQGRVFYRVRVGQLKSLDEANRMQEHLSNQGYPTHIYP